MKPNIFDIATSELSQDAFFTWLIKFADEQYKENELHQCGQAFLLALIKKQIPEFNDPIVNVKADRQWEYIDICVEINDKYFLIIEDKTFTSQHSNQLARYKEIATKKCQKKNWKLICIYLKKGNQSNFSLKKVRDKGFATFTRFEILDVLDKFNYLNNAIYQDFISHIKKLDEKYKHFLNKKIKDWNSSDWQGFYMWLENELNIVNWGFANNQNGGFWWAVINWETWNKLYDVYLQVEQKTLCFKISTDDYDGTEDKPNHKKARNDFYRFIMDNAKNNQIETIYRPERFGYGKYITCAKVAQKNWFALDDEYLDKEKTLKNIRFYADFLRKICGE